MKTRFNLLIPVAHSQGYRLARVTLDISKVTEEDKELALEHFFMKKVEQDLANPVEPWKEGDFITLDAKQYVPKPYTELGVNQPTLDEVSKKELVKKLEEREQRHRFLSGLPKNLQKKVEKLLEIYTLDEVKAVFQGRKVTG